MRRLTRGRVLHTIGGRSTAICSVSTSPSSHTTDEASQGRAKTHGEAGSYHTCACSNGGSSQREWKGTHLCGSHTPQQERPEGETSSSSRRAVFGTARRSCSLTTLDANSGFWQIPLDRESALLTTFITQVLFPPSPIQYHQNTSSDECLIFCQISREWCA